MPSWGNAVGGVVSTMELAEVAAELRSLIADPDVSPTTVTVSTPTGPPTIDEAAGTQTLNTDDDTVSVLRGEVGLEEVAELPGGLQLGDVRYHVLAADLSSTPTTASVVIDGSDRHQVIHVSADPLGLMHTLTARRLP